MANVSDDTNLIVFDADCIFCSGFARFMASHDKQADFRFVSARSDLGRTLYIKHDLDPDALETNIVILDGRAYTKMASFAASMKSLGKPWSLLAVVNLLPVSVANWIYDRIARNRYAFGKRSCPLPSRELKDRLID
ncbi:MAG: DCC1-like thiol-disulfide oxidoreductase family protein [Roseibium sp.]|uniref:thiol-disulfide oxidoreductase DCC family protein n=1 Tax=Roseibium sp. TaxID=1936156 RepID=UPI003D9C29B5